MEFALQSAAIERLLYSESGPSAARLLSVCQRPKAGIAKLPCDTFIYLYKPNFGERSMSLDQGALLAEIIGAVAVVASLIYLTVELRR